MFGWKPSDPINLQLQDLADYGNASTYAVPLNVMIFDVSPLSHAFETYPASERMYSLMNHELVHVMQSDVANDEDRRWRRLFLGKVVPQSRNPETLLYNYLTVPRFTSPRWLLEGSAVFFETWMGGGLGRAQGGYDEMVFRAMVRDDARFFDSLGLASYAATVDFQGTINNYLYGTRFVTWLAYAYSPEKVVEWLKRDDNSKRYYSDQFENVFGVPLDRAWLDWVAFEQEFQHQNLAEYASFPSRRSKYWRAVRWLLRAPTTTRTRARCTEDSSIPAPSNTSARWTRAAETCGRWRRSSEQWSIASHRSPSTRGPAPPSIPMTIAGFFPIAI